MFYSTLIIFALITLDNVFTAAIPEGLCLTKRCENLYEELDHNEIDKTCRSFSELRRRHCYCCGGMKHYTEFGDVCRRFCRKNVDENGNLSEPCSYTPREGDDDDSSLGFPKYPTLVPVILLDCGQGTNRTEARVDDDLRVAQSENDNEAKNEDNENSNKDDNASNNDDKSDDNANINDNNEGDDKSDGHCDESEKTDMEESEVPSLLDRVNNFLDREVELQKKTEESMKVNGDNNGNIDFSNKDSNNENDNNNDNNDDDKKGNNEEEDDNNETTTVQSLLDRVDDFLAIERKNESKAD